MSEITAEILEEFDPLIIPSHKYYNIRYYGFYGGRGGAKSYQVAECLILRAYAKKEFVLCGREFLNSINESVKSLLSWAIKKNNLQSFYTETNNQILGKNGSKFIFKGVKENIESIKSMTGISICWIEEASTVSQKTLDVLIPTVRDKGSFFIFTFNPRYADDPVYEKFIKNKEFYKDDLYIKKLSYKKNPWISQEFIKEAETLKKINYDKYLHVYGGELLENNEAQIFRNWTIDDSIKPSSNEIFYFGADWGFSDDPTVLIRCWVNIEKRTIFIDYEAYKVKCEIDNIPALFDTIPESRNCYIVGDSSRPETISYLNRAGFTIIKSKKAKGSTGLGYIEDGIEFLKSFNIKVHSRCKNMIYELKNYSYKVDDRTEVITNKPIDKNNHCIDSARYALEPFRRSGRHNIH